MERVYTRPLADDEMRPQLEAMATILFDGHAIQWHEVERQVERLGFGNSYIVSSTQGRSGNDARVSLKPDLIPGLTKQVSDPSTFNLQGKT